MTVQCLPRYSDAYEAAVDDAIASCDGSLRGALKVLIIANEFLERDLEKALASDPDPSIAHDGDEHSSLLAKVEQAEIGCKPVIDGCIGNQKYRRSISGHRIDDLFR